MISLPQLLFWQSTIDGCYEIVILKTIMLKRFRITPYSLVVSLCLMMIGLLGSYQSVAATSNSQAVAQGYLSSSPLQPGMIVRLDSNNPNHVTAVDLKNINKMLGVVVSANDAAITLGQSSGSNQAYVTNFGLQNVLVTNQNGAIKVGDYVTISDIAGIGMKADANEPTTLGQAAGNFDGIHNVESTSVLKLSNGQTINVNIGLIPVDISIANNPLSQGPKGIPRFLENITKFATNKSVSATRVYLGMLIIIAGIILSITVIYAGIRNSMISMGRNPLAKKAITSGLVRLVLGAIIIFAISLGAAYAVLL